MRALVLGATGNLGSRLLPVLIKQGHTAVAFVRNPLKLAPEVRAQLSAVEQGDARIAFQIKDAATRNRCDAIVNTAGLAAMAPWGRVISPLSSTLSSKLQLKLVKNAGVRCGYGFWPGKRSSISRHGST